MKREPGGRRGLRGGGSLGWAEDLGSPSASACGAGGRRPELLERIVAEGTRVAEEATMANGTGLVPASGIPGAVGGEGEGARSHGSRSLDKVTRRWEVRQGAALGHLGLAFPGATRGLRRPYVTLCHRMEEGRLWRNANAPDKGTGCRDHKSTTKVQVCQPSG